jgi:predicted ATP-dependent serine protease
MLVSSPGEPYGRETELVAIRHELGRLAGGASAAIVIEGGAGIGKSRLLAEILDVGTVESLKPGVRLREPK